jgi:cytochrome c-type biogenesis protein CcmH/NrfG
MSIFDVTNDSVFAATLYQSGQIEDIAKRVLNKGLQSFVDNNYADAVTAFKQSAALAPNTSTGINALDYLARAYLGQGDTEAAIKAYKQVLRVAPTRDDLHSALGNLYYSEERFAEATASYELAVRANPSAVNRYSLGQGYLAEGRFSDAEAQFNLVRRFSPSEPHGDFGLGQVYAKQGRYDEALNALQRATSIQADYWNAYAEMGYVLADQGEIEKAESMVDFLSTRDETLSSTLDAYVYDKSPPQMTSTSSGGFANMFLDILGPKTSVSILGENLANAGGQQTLSIVFQFSKAMDPDSIENVMNWSIQREPSTRTSAGYNFGSPVPSTEVALPNTPLAVYYDSTYMTATVLFKVQQNDTADGTIDPSHIQFTFKGTDAVGQSMDPNADQYSGFSGFA